VDNEPLVRAHDALTFLGAVKMLELSSFELSVAISAAEVWASGTGCGRRWCTWLMPYRTAT
jgi:hypothetical protein